MQKHFIVFNWHIFIRTQLADTKKLTRFKSRAVKTRYLARFKQNAT